MSDYQRLGLQGDKACRMDVEEPTLAVRLCSVVIMRMAQVMMIMTVGVNGSVVICMRIDRQHVESSGSAIVQVMRVAGLRGCSARPDDRHGQDGRYDLTHPGHLIPDYTTYDYCPDFL